MVDSKVMIATNQCELDISNAAKPSAKPITAATEPVITGGRILSIALYPFFCLALWSWWKVS